MHVDVYMLHWMLYHMLYFVSYHSLEHRFVSHVASFKSLICYQFELNVSLSVFLWFFLKCARYFAVANFFVFAVSYSSLKHRLVTAGLKSVLMILMFDDVFINMFNI